MQSAAVLHKFGTVGISFLRVGKEVDRHFYDVGFHGIASAEEVAVIEIVQLVAAYLHFLLPSHHCCACDVGVAEAVAVALGVGVHCRSQRLRYAYVVNNQATLLFRKHTVHARYGLHQVVAAHGLVNIHGGK